MNYTMTMDMPTKATSYVERRGKHFQLQLQSLVIAFVTAEMQRDGFEWKAPEGTSNGKAVFDAIRACPEDVDFDQLITKRTSCGRVHPVDFAAMRRDMLYTGAQTCNPFEKEVTG